jgi:ribosome modulation factor
MGSAKTLLLELESKSRTPWEQNGYVHGLAGIDNKVPYGRMSTRDSYMMGWRDGDQVRKMREAQAETGE